MVQLFNIGPTIAFNTYLNTYHVMVQPPKRFLISLYRAYLNTYHVMVQRTGCISFRRVDGFKYISCYGSTNSDNRIIWEQS